MNNLDNSSKKLRYHVIDKNDNASYPDFSWINLEEIVKSVREFINQLDELDYEKIRKY